MVKCFKFFKKYCSYVLVSHDDKEKAMVLAGIIANKINEICKDTNISGLHTTNVRATVNCTNVVIAIMDNNHFPFCGAFKFEDVQNIQRVYPFMSFECHVDKLSNRTSFEMFGHSTGPKHVDGSMDSKIEKFFTDIDDMLDIFYTGNFDNIVNKLV